VESTFELDRQRVIAAYKKHGHEISSDEADEIWGDYCQKEYFASWMDTGDDLDWIFKETYQYAEPILKERS
jgi:hypothetical protein